MSLILAGCVSSGIKVSDDKLSSLEVNKTTKSEVLQSLGKPSSQIKNSDGTSVIVYSRVKASAKATSYIPIVGLFAGGVNSEATNVILHFDASETLTNYQTTSAENDTSTGLLSN